jgi:hypothetical protein
MLQPSSKMASILRQLVKYSVDPWALNAQMTKHFPTICLKNDFAAFSTRMRVCERLINARREKNPQWKEQRHCGQRTPTFLKVYTLRACR